MSIEKAISVLLESHLEDSKKSHALYLLCSFEHSSQLQKQLQNQKYFKVKNPPQETFVYLIGNSEGHIKIGFSGNPEKRLSQLKTGCHSATLLYKFLGTIEDERQLHALFANKQISNEWFLLSESDIELIISFFGNKKTEKQVARKGFGKSVGIEYEIIKNAVINGDFFIFKETASVRGLVDYTRSISPTGSGIGKDTASIYMNLLKKDGCPLSKEEWKRLYKNIS